MKYGKVILSGMMLITVFTSCAELFEVDEVEEPQFAEVELSFDRRTVDLLVGDEYQLPVTVKADSVTNAAIYWESADSSIVSVNDGIIDALAPGETMVKATAVSVLKSDSCRVRVLPYWAVDPYKYQYDMVVYANVTVGGRQADQSVMVAAFARGENGEEVRGVGSIRQSEGISYMQLRVYSNVQEGETLTLRCYDRRRLLLVECKEALVFENATTWGTLSRLQNIEFD